VIGYDDSDLAEALDLTSVHQPFAETGRIAMSLLFAALEGTSAAPSRSASSPVLPSAEQPDRVIVRRSHSRRRGHGPRRPGPVQAGGPDGGQRGVQQACEVLPERAALRAGLGEPRVYEPAGERVV
jgi:hypothetical protein